MSQECSCFLGHPHGAGEDERCLCTTSIVECLVHGLGKSDVTVEEILSFYTKLTAGGRPVPFELGSLDDVEREHGAEKDR